MGMKKNSSLFLISILLLLFFSSCNKEDISPAESLVQNTIDGLWNLTELSILYQGQTLVLTPNQVNLDMILIISKDKTYLIKRTENGITSYDNGTWEILENYLTLFHHDGTYETKVYGLVNNKLTVSMTTRYDNIELPAAMVFTRH